MRSPEDVYLTAGEIGGMVSRFSVEDFEAAAANPKVCAEHRHLLKLLAAFRRDLFGPLPPLSPTLSPSTPDQAGP